MISTVSTQAIIRDMDADEVLNFIAHLSGTEDPTGEHMHLVNLAKQQYRQLTNTELTPNTPGISIAVASMVAASELVEEMNY